MRFLCSHRPAARSNVIGYPVDGRQGAGYTLKMLEPLPDEYFMREALRQAQKAHAAAEVPVGTVIVREDGTDNKFSFIVPPQVLK